MPFSLSDLLNKASDNLAVLLALVPVVILILHMHNELRTRGVLAQREGIYFEDVDLAIDL